MAPCHLRILNVRLHSVFNLFAGYTGAFGQYLPDRSFQPAQTVLARSIEFVCGLLGGIHTRRDGEASKRSEDIRVRMRGN